MYEEVFQPIQNTGDITIALASPDIIRSWSFGEVTKPETINYRSFKPEKDGLFCEKIFGPVKNWECNCGKYKRIRYKGVVCDRCGVEVTHSKVRRQRMGHIELAIPVAHQWFFRSTPCIIGALLAKSASDLESIIYYEKYIVIDKGDTDLKVGDLIEEDKYQDLVDEGRHFDAKMGAPAIKQMLARLSSENSLRALSLQLYAAVMPILNAEQREPLLVELRAHEGLKRLPEDLRAAIDAGNDLSSVIRETMVGEEGQAQSDKNPVQKAMLEMPEDLSRLLIRLAVPTSVRKSRIEEALKRLKVVEAFRRSANRPEWMVLDVLPVLPPDLRPLVPLDGGRFATSDLNELYRRVINRNNRLKKLIDIRAPDVILRNEKRMLQEAVDTLFDGSRRGTGRGEGARRPLKSLSELLKGKQGRFRQNLLGKRVDYSGRSVIVVGPELRMHQCGLPKSIALELYKPFIIQRLEEAGFVHTVKSAKKFVEKERPEVWDILEEIIEDHPVMLNRAPTLHRLGIQAFYPKLIEGKAIRLHPLVCAAFNADFDGDQMAVHLPLSPEAQLECRVLMLSSNNILHPASGQPIAVPSQDIVLGLYYLTKPRPGQTGEGKAFADSSEVVRAYEAGAVALHAKIKLRLPAGRKIYRSVVERDVLVRRESGEEVKLIKGAKAELVTILEATFIETTPGRVFFNEILPNELGYANDTFAKKVISKSVDDLYRRTGNRVTVGYLDNLKDMGYRWATRAGSSVAIFDMVVPGSKGAKLKDTEEKVEKILNLYNDGVITDGERYNQVIDAWTHVTNDIANQLFDELQRDRDGFNPVFMMADSGARGSREQIKQLSGMRGLMQKPTKKLGGQEVIENPIKSSFRDGLNVLEYFISTHGARKGLADTALKTADAGYLTRRLVDVAQDLVITEVDCGTLNGIELSAVKDGDDVVMPLEERILGRVSQGDILHPVTGEALVSDGEIIEEIHVRRIMDAGLEAIKLRSVLTCESVRGVCSKCYGRNLANGRSVDMGEAVGVIAAQSIGEPGTQLTLRTFHIGGASSRLAVESAKKAPVDKGVQSFRVQLDGVDTIDSGKQVIVISRNGECRLFDNNGIQKVHYQVPYGALLKVTDGSEVKAGTVMFEWDPYNSPIIATQTGKVQFLDIELGRTLRAESDESTGVDTFHITADKRGRLKPTMQILNSNGDKIGAFMLPDGAILAVREGEKVDLGHTLARIPRAAGKTRDITGGLPRVAELFEARQPKSPAVIAPIDGTVSYGGEERGNTRIVITPAEEGSEPETVLIPRGKHLQVHEGDRVRAGEKLCDGSVNPHDILRVLGEEAVQQYVISEIQKVYRLQGVSISDKHIECIVRQMMRKVKVADSGDSNFLPEEEVSRARLRAENEALVAHGRKAARPRPMLLGITRSSLGTDSFISAASFQETTKILTRAAIEGRRDKLVGLKENVIMGRLIPSGTGALHLREVEVKDMDAEASFAARTDEERLESKLEPAFGGEGLHDEEEIDGV